MTALAPVIRPARSEHEPGSTPATPASRAPPPTTTARTTRQQPAPPATGGGIEHALQATRPRTHNNLLRPIDPTTLKQALDNDTAQTATTQTPT